MPGIELSRYCIHWTPFRRRLDEYRVGARQQDRTRQVQPAFSAGGHDLQPTQSWHRGELLRRRVADRDLRLRQQRGRRLAKSRHHEICMRLEIGVPEDHRLRHDDSVVPLHAPASCLLCGQS